MKSNPYKGKKYRIYGQKKADRRSFRHRSAADRPLSGILGNRAPLAPQSRRKHRWIGSKDLYIDSPGQKRRPAWLIPLLLILGISVMAFWLGPLLLNTIAGTFSHETQPGPQENFLYDGADYAVVKKQAADLFETPDLKAKRKTQALYNQLVHIVDRSTYGFYGVELEDGAQGFIMSEDVTSYTKSVEPSLYEYKIIVISASKRVMTHSSNGSTIMEAMMGTVLYSNYQGDDVYKVTLPDGTEGWISASGVLKIRTSEKIAKSNAKSFYTTVLSFNNTTYIDNGLTIKGASSEGIAYIAAMINGILLPRDKEAQSLMGEEVPLQYNAETGALQYDNLQEGDLIFFKSAADPEKVGEMGVIVGYGQVLMSRNSKASVKILNLDSQNELKQSVLRVRRLF